MRLLFLLLIFSQIGYAQTLETVIQKGHELAVLTVAVSPDSNFVATGSKDKSIKLWEIKTGREVRSYLGHEMTVNNVRFSPDGKLLISGSNDKTVRIWDVATGKSLSVIPTEDYIFNIAIDRSMKYLVAGGYNDSGYPDSAMVFDFKTRRLLKRININSRSTGVGISFSPDGKYLGFGEDNRIVNIYETGTWKNTHKFTYEEGWCGGCATLMTFSPDGKFIYMASHNGPAKKYELASSKLVNVYEENSENLTGLALSPDGKKLARTTEKDLIIWDTGNGEQIAKTEAEEKGEFHEITFTPNSKGLIVTSDNNTAFIWNIAQGRNEKVFTGFLNNRDLGGLNYDPNFYWQSHIARYVRFKNAVLVSNDGKSLIKGKFGTKVKRWDIATGKTLMEYTGHKRAVLCYELSKDGKRLLTGGGDGKIMLWNVETGDSIQSIESYQEPIFDIHFSSDETQVFSSSWDATMKVHDLKTGKLITRFDLENNSAYSIIFHPSDLYLFTGRLDNSIQMWEIDTHKEVRNFIGHTGIISSIRLSPDTRSVLSSSWDGSIRLWDVSTGLMTKKFKGHVGSVHTAIFSPDAFSVYSGGADRIIRVWDISSGKITRTFEGHNAEITSLIFSPDKKMLISHSVDGVTKFWDLNTGKEFFEHIHFGPNDWMAKNPEGYFNGTDEARKYIHFVSGLKTYSVDQFFNDFYRPDLLPKIFQNRGGNDDSKGIQGKLKDSPPPTVQVAAVPTTNGKAELYVRITDNGAGVENLRVQHNGKSIELDRGILKLPSGKGQSTTYKHPIDMVGGTNTFTAVASNKDKVESDPHTTELFSDHAAKSSTCHIFAVGINEYKNNKLNLNYAKPDAESFTKAVDEKSTSLFKDIQLYTLYDKDATRQKILAKLDELSSQIHQEDVFIFYYAGHGSMVEDKFYFIPTESIRLYDEASLQKEAIEASVLQEKLRNIKALKQLIVMDACQSGGSVELLATRGAGEEKAIAQLSRSAGIHVMASAGSEQFATEFTELGHGLFTYVLIKALQGAADGAPKDGKVTIYELKSYIDDQVPEMTKQLKGKPQYPFTFSRGQDFPVVMQE
ncbi:MAG TPA: caspase family protein [Ohtaekwangia sp.]